MSSLHLLHTLFLIVYTFMLIMVYARMLQTGSAWFGILVLVLLYWLRSEREDVFMAGSNPEYPEYRRRVTCKFIPGLV